MESENIRTIYTLRSCYDESYNCYGHFTTREKADEAMRSPRHYFVILESKQVKIEGKWHWLGAYFSKPLDIKE